MTNRIKTVYTNELEYVSGGDTIRVYDRRLNVLLSLNSEYRYIYTSLYDAYIIWYKLTASELRVIKAQQFIDKYCMLINGDYNQLYLFDAKY